MPVIRSGQDDLPGKDSAQQIPLCTVEEEGLLYVKARGNKLLLEAIVEDSREVGGARASWGKLKPWCQP